MSNAIELLLNANKEDFERPSEIVEIPRISKILGEKFELKLKALSIGKNNKLRMECVDQKTQNIDFVKLQMRCLIEGTFDVEEGTYFFKNKQLQKAYGVPNAEELINKLLVTGEVDYLFERIDALSSFDDSVVEEIKN